MGLLNVLKLEIPLKLHICSFTFGTCGWVNEDQIIIIILWWKIVDIPSSVVNTTVVEIKYTLMMHENKKMYYKSANAVIGKTTFVDWNKAEIEFKY